MGYQTNYDLQLTLMIGGKKAELVDDAPLKSVIYALRESLEEARYSIDDDGNSTGEEARWYEHESDMIAFSARNPGILFALHGEGEEASDQWTKYFLDGKCQVEKAVIQIAPFDAKKLR